MNWTWTKVVVVSVIVIAVGGLSYLCGERNMKRIVGYIALALAAVGIGRKAIPAILNKVASKWFLVALFTGLLIVLAGCGNNWFADIDERQETVQVLYIDGVPHLDKDSDSEFETPTTQMELDILAQNGTQITIMNPEGKP